MTGYSREAVLLHLIEDWRNALDNKCVVCAVSMDMSKAFDMIPHDLLHAKLAAYSVAPVSLPLLHSYLRDRSQRVRIEDVTSDVVVFSKAVPQGSVLGPSFLTFFLMICSILLIVLICATMLMITKLILVIVILRW